MHTHHTEVMWQAIQKRKLMDLQATAEELKKKATELLNVEEEQQQEIFSSKVFNALEEIEAVTYPNDLNGLQQWISSSEAVITKAEEVLQTKKTEDPSSDSAPVSMTHPHFHR